MTTASKQAKPEMTPQRQAELRKLRHLQDEAIKAQERATRATAARDAEIRRLREDGGFTLQSIGAVLGVGRERVRQLAQR